jgi:hypothetical protein
MNLLKINPHLTLKTFKLDDIDSAVYVIDDFLINTGDLTSYTRNTAYLNPVGSDGTAYPGMRDAMPMPYIRLLKKLIEDNILTTLVNSPSSVEIHRSLLSLTTVSESNLNTLQKMPHIDSFMDTEFASVHYLCDKEMGGTSIYKYKPSNIIRFNEKHRHLLNQAKQMVENNRLEHKGYLKHSTSLFEKVFSIEAKFNRIVIYPGNLLHCANLKDNMSINTDINKGRLTIASFFSIT